MKTLDKFSHSNSGTAGLLNMVNALNFKFEL